MNIMRDAVRAAALAASLGGFAGAAAAADLGGSLKDDETIFVTPASPYYLAGRGGATFAEDTDFDIGGGATGVSNSYDDPGFFVSGAIGADLGVLAGWTGWRAELELLYLENAIDQHNVGGVPFASSDSFGDTIAFVGLASLFYDFLPGAEITPFVGAGIGYANVEFDGHGVTPAGVVMNDDENGFAWHLTAGASYAVNETIKLEAGYRYLAIEGVDLTSTDGTSSSTDVDNHLAYVGMRIGF